MKFKHVMNDDGLFELALGWIFGFSAGVCLLALAAGIVIASAPQLIPRPLLLLLGVPIG